MGVSLIGLAMINTYLCEISLQSYAFFRKLDANGALKVQKGRRESSKIIGLAKCFGHSFRCVVII
jgi:hypothetical protein